MGEINRTTLDIDRDKEIFEIAKQCLEDGTFNIVTLTVVGLSLFPAIFGNIIIVLCYLKFRCFHDKAIYRFIVNLAISDLLLGGTLLLYPLQDIYPEIGHYKYFCICRFSLVLWSISSSTSFISAISIDRYLSVIFPFHHMVECQNKRLIWLVVISSWVGTFSACLTQAFFNNLNDFDVYDVNVPCVNSVTVTDTWHYITDFAIIISLFFDVIFYLFVMNSIRKNRQVSTESYSLGSVIAKTKVMIIVYVTFVVCWLPMISVDLYFLFHKDTASRAFICWRDYLFVLGILQSCTNWIYYGIWNAQFRKAFRTMLSCKASVPDQSLNRPTTT